MNASQRGRSNRYNGRRFQSDLARWLREYGGFPHAESAAGNGWRTKSHVSEDPFDITGTPGLVWSLKRLTKPSEAELRRYLNEVHTVASGRGAVGLLVVKRAGTTDLGRSWCYRQLPQPYVHVPWLAVRAELADMVALLRAEGYGDPLEMKDAT